MSDTSQVWGTSVKHSRGQKVGLSHVLADEECVPAFYLFPSRFR